MIFEDNFIQNGDDCLAVQSGASNISFRYLATVFTLLALICERPRRKTYCEGGHGVSIGSLGKAGQVANVQNVL